MPADSHPAWGERWGHPLPGLHWLPGIFVLVPGREAGGRRGCVRDGPLQTAAHSPALVPAAADSAGVRASAFCLNLSRPPPPAWPHLLLHREPRCSREVPRPFECASGGFWAAGPGRDGALQVPAAPWLRDTLSPTLSLPSFPCEPWLCLPPPTARAEAAVDVGT